MIILIMVMSLSMIMAMICIITMFKMVDGYEDNNDEDYDQGHES